MYPRLRTFLLAALVLMSTPSLSAQTPADPSGHWEGTVQVPDSSMSIEVDLAKNGAGKLSGTISIPSEKLKGLPLRLVTVEGRSVNFRAREDQPFTGVLSDDGTLLSGTLTMEGYSLAMSLRRTGDARIEVPARSAAIAAELEGTWNGTMDVKGKQLHIVLTMLNQADGTAIGSVVNLDQGRLEIPVTVIAQSASTLTFDLRAVGGSYAGTFNNDRTELVGTYRQGALEAPMTFRRAAPDKK